MNLIEVKQYYSQIVDTQSNILKKLKKSIFQIGTLRLIVVLLCAILTYFFWNSTMICIASIVAFSIIFAALLKHHNTLFKKKRYAEIQIENATNELNGIAYDFSAFDGAASKINHEHDYSFDLDLFGDRSFFQSINRTVTEFGKDCLANTISSPLREKATIYKQQNAIKELSGKPQLMSHFRALGKVSKLDNINIKELSEISNRSKNFYLNKFWQPLLYLVPVLSIIVFILYFFNIITVSVAITFWVAMLVLSSIPTKKVLSIYNLMDKKSNQLDTYSELFKIIEDQTFESEQLIEAQKIICDTSKASEAIQILKKYQSNLSQSFSFPILLIFNPFLLWNVRYASKIEKWSHTYQDKLNTWFDVIGKFDALISIAMFAFNHPDYTYPTCAESFKFDAISLGHPLINREKCVKNDVKIAQSPYFLVVTGANMAGKSTYLRTIGINHILACIGSVVCAESLVFYPNKLVTNLRTSDSLLDDESYFFAELKRLKMIIDYLKNDENIFIILDEILKGTNSEDKQKGSLALMKQLISLKGNGIIATHDLLLGNLEKEFSLNIKNYRFEADITNEQLSFSYKIREGVAQNMNACFLMRKMGITGI